MGGKLVRDVDYLGVKESLLGSHGIVDLDKAIKAIQFRVGERLIDIDKINNAAKEGLVYVDERGIILEGITEKDEKMSRYKFVPLGYRDKFTGDPICASFMKGSFGWEGIFVGTVEKLIERIMKNYEQWGGTITDEERETVEQFRGTFHLKGFGLSEVLEYNKNIKQSITVGIEGSNMEKLLDIKDRLKKEESRNSVLEDSLRDEIYDRLLIKENWKSSEKDRLGAYIKTIMEKIMYEQSIAKGEHRGNGYILNEDKGKCIFNTGLIDKYGNDIYLIDLDNKNNNLYEKEIRIVDSKVSAMQFGFNKEDVINMPKPIKFYEDKSDLIFDGTISEFDLGDNGRLYHIIEERRIRFPEEYRDVSCDVLAEKIKSAINKAIRLSERDFKYVVPMYNLKMNKIQYLMPLHLGTSIEEPPELTIVVGKNRGLYCVYTVLETDDAYDNARVLCRPDSAWLRLD